MIQIQNTENLNSVHTSMTTDDFPTPTSPKYASVSKTCYLAIYIITYQYQTGQDQSKTNQDLN